jgi:hypothetical protein
MHKGVRLIYMPGIETKTMGTLTHTQVSRGGDLSKGSGDGRTRNAASLSGGVWDGQREHRHMAFYIALSLIRVDFRSAWAVIRGVGAFPGMWYRVTRGI